MCSFENMTCKFTILITSKSSQSWQRILSVACNPYGFEHGRVGPTCMVTCILQKHGSIRNRGIEKFFGGRTVPEQGGRIILEVEIWCFLFRVTFSVLSNKLQDFI